MASNLEFVKNVNFNTSPSSSTLEIDEVFTDRYDSYFVNLTKIDGNLSGYYIAMKFLNSSGSLITASSYDWASQQMASDNTYAESKGTSTTLINNIGYSGSGGLDDDKFDGGTSMYIHYPASSSHYTFINAQASGFNNSGVLYSFKTVGVLKSKEAVRGFRLSGHSAFYGVNISVYGVK